MSKGEIAWIKISPAYHKNIFSKVNKDHVKVEVGDQIFIKLTIDSIKRLPKCKDDKTFKGQV